MVRTGGMRQPRRSGDGADTLLMDGPEIFAFTIAAVPATVRQLLARTGITDRDVDLYVFHQANRLMLDRVRNASSRSLPTSSTTPLSTPATRSPPPSPSPCHGPGRPAPCTPATRSCSSGSASATRGPPRCYAGPPLQRSEQHPSPPSPANGSRSPQGGAAARFRRPDGDIPPARPGNVAVCHHRGTVAGIRPRILDGGGGNFLIVGRGFAYSAS